MSGRVGVVIVTYNSKAFAGRAIDSCLREGLDVVVVDNASEDGTADSVAVKPGVRLVRNLENRGFAAGVNEGFRRLETECVLLLNPDAELMTSVTAMEQELSEAGAVGGMLVGSNDGAVQSGFTVRRFPTAITLGFEVLGVNRLWRGNRENRRYRCQDLSLTAATDVDQPAAAFLMVRKDAWQKIGGFDERFFPVWFEDVDFCFRLKEAGYRVRYTPQAVARHEGGHSVGAIPDGPRQLYWYGSLLSYANKHFSAGHRRFVCAAVVVGSLFRMFAAVLLDLRVRAIFIYVRVIRLAIRFV